MRAVARGILLWFSNLGPTAVQDPWKPLQLVVMGGLALAAFLWYVVPEARLKDFAHESMLKQREAQDAVARTEKAHAEAAELLGIAEAARSEVNSLRSEYERLRIESRAAETKLSASIAEADDLAKERDRLSAAVDRSSHVLRELTGQRDFVSSQLNEARTRLTDLSHRTSCFVTDLFIAKIIEDGRWYSSDVVWAGEPGFHVPGQPRSIMVTLPSDGVDRDNFDGGEGGDPPDFADGDGVGNGFGSGGNGGGGGGEASLFNVTAWLAYIDLSIKRDALGPLRDRNPTADNIIRRRLAMPEMQLLATDERLRFEKMVNRVLESPNYKSAMHEALRLAPISVPHTAMSSDGKLTQEGHRLATERYGKAQQQHLENHKGFVNVVQVLYRELRLGFCDPKTSKLR